MKWARVFLISLLLVVTGIEVAGYFLPNRLDVEREAVIEAPIEDVFAVVSNLRGWEQWSPILASREDIETRVEFLETAPGDGEQLEVSFDDRLKILFSVVESVAPTRFVLNSRTGRVEDDLLAGTSFEGWDEFDLETTASGGTLVRWRRTSAEVESYWLRVVDAVASKPQVVKQLEAGLAALSEAVEFGPR